jgi:type IV secretory pathway protease TraF
VAPIGKSVLAVGGDTVIAASDGLCVNGRPVPHSRVASRDSRGRPIPHAPFGRYILQPNQVWLFSHYHSLSFDSRYFGPVDRALLRGRISPIVTLHRGHLNLFGNTGREPDLAEPREVQPKPTEAGSCLLLGI